MVDFIVILIIELIGSTSVENVCQSDPCFGEESWGVLFTFAIQLLHFCPTDLFSTIQYSVLLLLNYFNNVKNKENIGFSPISAFFQSTIQSRQIHSVYSLVALVED